MKKLLLVFLFPLIRCVNIIASDQIEYWDTPKAFILEKGNVTAFYLKDEKQYIAQEKITTVPMLGRTSKSLQIPLKNPQGVYEDLQREYVAQEYGPTESYELSKEPDEQLG